MKDLIEQLQITCKMDEPCAFMVIDTENKTNKQMKAEVESRVKMMFDKAIEQELSEIGKLHLPEKQIEGLQKAILAEKQTELDEMLRQFYIQIDIILPE